MLRESSGHDFRRDAITGLQQDHITWDDLLGVDREFASIANDRRAGTTHRHERLERLLGAGFLDETDDRVDEHHPEDHARIDRLPQSGGHGTGDHQDYHQRVFELKQEAKQRPAPAKPRQRVQPETRQPGRRLRLSQPPLPVSANQQQRLMHVEVMKPAPPDRW